MQDKTIESIAYLIKEAKKLNKPKPIILLGAGMSVSAGIPLANDIVDDIFQKFNEKPEIKELISRGDKSYYNVMEVLTPQERKSLLKGYIRADKVKINVGHIYLAQLLKYEYVDYILTVNFDDLLLRASGLFNFLPPTYDVTTMNDLTTNNIESQSVTYLHGQHHGLWLLNSPDELNETEKIIPKLFERICNERTWIIIGYSGEDKIFDYVKSLGSFANNLYWVGYKNNDPSDKVKELLHTRNKNAYLIKGYDADLFFMKLNAEIKKMNNDSDLDTPEILRNPFSYVNNVLENVKDIADNHEYKDINKRLLISKKIARKAEKEYQERESIEKIILQMIEDRINKDFDNIDYYTIEVEKNRNDKDLNDAFLNFVNGYALEFFKNKDYKTSLRIFDSAITYDANNQYLWFNKGFALLAEGITTNNIAKLNESIEAFQQCLTINLNYNEARICIGEIMCRIGDIEKNKNKLLEGIAIIEKYVDNVDFKNQHYDILGTAYILLVHLENKDKVKRKYLIKAKNYSLKGYNLNGKSYNLACSYALLKEEEEALIYLEKSLKNKEHTVDAIRNDRDWINFLQKKDFIRILEKYK